MTEVRARVEPSFCFLIVLLDRTQIISRFDRGHDDVGYGSERIGARTGMLRRWRPSGSAGSFDSGCAA